MKTNAEAITTENTAAVAAPGADVPPEKAPSKHGASQKKGARIRHKRAKAAKPAAKPKARKAGRHSKPAADKPVARAGTAKAKVIALIERRGGATLAEIMKATGWLPHTVRGFVSTLGKHGIKIESSRRESDEARVYEVARQEEK